MTLYEATFVVRQDLTVSDVEKVTENYINLIKNNGGAILKREYWGLRNLAYIIKKNRKGHYVMLGVQSDHETMKEMERLIGLSDDIIRNLILEVDEIDENPSPMMNANDNDGEEGKKFVKRDNEE